MLIMPYCRAQEEKSGKNNLEFSLKNEEKRQKLLSIYILYRKIGQK